jgi:hypothetical protein
MGGWEYRGNILTPFGSDPDNARCFGGQAPSTQSSPLKGEEDNLADLYDLLLDGAIH